MAGEHVITQSRPASEDSPLEFKVIVRGRKTLFSIAYQPGTSRGEIGSIAILVKADKGRGETVKEWLASPNERAIGIFRRTWKDHEHALSETATASADEVLRMLAYVSYRKGDEEEIYLYPLAEVFKEEANQAPEPTSLLVTPRAGARVAPSSAVAHL